MLCLLVSFSVFSQERIRDVRTNPDIYFLKIDDVKFRQKVVPGDTLLFKVELLGPVRHGISSMKGYVFVGDQVVSEATFTAQIAKNK